MSSLGKALVASFPIIFSLYANQYQQENRMVAFPDTPKDVNLPMEKTYDFIVVGAGTGGCIVARRLVDAGFTVLLLEAGGDPPPLTTVPALWDAMRYTSPEIMFIYPSVPQKNAALAYMPRGVFPTMTGKMMGGTTGVNAMVYNRGNAPDYNNWAEITGDPSWRYENVLQYWLKAERYRGEYPNNGQHNPNGLMTVIKESYTVGRETWKQAGEELRFPFGDPNGPQISEFSPIEVTVKENGTRESTYTAYIQPIERTQKNLVVERYAVVSKVIIEQVGGKQVATGVEYTHHKVPRVAKAKQGVILAAGTYISPLILINSGVGPEGPLVKLPIGANFHDHNSISIPFEAPYKFHYDIEKNLSQSDIDNYLNNGKGPLATLLAPTQCFIDSGRDQPPDVPLTERKRPEGKYNVNPEGTWPDMTLFFDYPLVFNPFDKAANHVECAVVLGRPRSRGTVKLNKTAIPLGFDHPTIPIIDYQWFTEPTDINVAVAGIRMCEKIVKSNAFKKVGARWLTNKNKDRTKQCRNFRANSDDYWKCYIKQFAVGVYHTVGSIKMGNKNEKGTCVDSRLRVLGVENLRVADASIMPQTPNANTHAPVVMIAEKAADMIIQDTRSKQFGSG